MPTYWVKTKIKTSKHVLSQFRDFGTIKTTWPDGSITFETEALKTLDKVCKRLEIEFEPT